VTTPLWVSELVALFWSTAGQSEPFPRNLRQAIANTLPLSVVFLPRLRVAGVESWLRKQGIQCSTNVLDRALRACLVARYGQGLIFIDGGDLEDEQRFSLAHELAHFLRDYWQPRRSASERLGPDVLEALDGHRPPRREERIHAILARVPIGFYVHLMERTTSGHAASPVIDASEHEADRLAFELLAPSEVVLKETEGSPSSRRLAETSHLLTTKYGLPTTQAAYYASRLMPSTGSDVTFVRRLRPTP
jgi:Zn-dependent peptidase ImmA (M78 family)